MDMWPLGRPHACIFAFVCVCLDVSVSDLYAHVHKYVIFCEMWLCVWQQQFCFKCYFMCMVGILQAELDHGYLGSMQAGMVGSSRMHYS